MIDVHQNLGFVEKFFCRVSRVIDNRCKIMSVSSSAIVCSHVFWLK